MQTLALFIADSPGVINRVVSQFRRRGVNIVSMTVGGTERPSVARMTLVVDADEHGGRQAVLHLRKLVPVLQVINISGDDCVARDLALLKVHADHDQRSDVIELAKACHARVVDIGHDSVMLEATADRSEIDHLVTVLRPFGILEIARSGSVVMSRGVAAVPSCTRIGE